MPAILGEAGCRRKTVPYGGRLCAARRIFPLTLLANLYPVCARMRHRAKSRKSNNSNNP